jgi:hypothetical protein
VSRAFIDDFGASGSLTDCARSVPRDQYIGKSNWPDQ